MNPSSIPSHSGSNGSSIIKQNIQSCVTDRLRKYALIVTSIFCSIVAIAMVAIVACGFTQPAILACLLISLIVAGVMLVLMVRHIRETRPVLPSGFLSVIKREFPTVIYELVVQERLNLQELRAVLLGLSSGVFTFPSIACQKKVERFGLERLQKGCEGIELPDLEKILLKNCPFYFVNKFIQLGPKEFPEAENMDPALYWVSRTGFSSTCNTVFDPYVWLLAHVVTQQEYEMLLSHAKDSTWDQIRETFVKGELRNRLGALIDTVDIEYFDTKRDSLKACLGGLGFTWLLYLCKHGVCWEQLQLFKEIESRDINFIAMFDVSSRGMTTTKLIYAIAPYIDENKEEFDPFISLITWDQWIQEYKNNKHNRRWRFFKGTMNFLNKQSKHILKYDDIPGSPSYSIDNRTGRRTLDYGPFDDGKNQEIE
ncbi:DUF1389 domain-containing protein [Chlamydia sp. 04-14]|uniref:DUF1389 domain-containing protein n=1 Tax=Chlamydia TaxID=810 RepID=UPI002FCB0827